MTIDQRTHFWVLFDTATRPPYYADVHQVLALPEGTLKTYDYREKRLDAHAQEAAALPTRRQPRQVLIVYTQATTYERGGGDFERPVAFEDMLWQPLRLAEMVSCWRDGEHYNFRFKVRGYPNGASIDPLVQELHSRSAVPPNAWVAVSNRSSVLADLVAVDEQFAWQEVVNRLATPPMQFEGDMFWRALPPRRSGRRRRNTALRSRTAGSYGDSDVSQKYVVPERSEFTVPVATHEPTDSRRSRTARLDLDVPDDGPIFPPYPSTVELRRNANIPVALESKHSAKAERRRGSLQLASPDASNWGDLIELRFEMRLARWKWTTGVLLMAVGVAAAAANTAGLLTAVGVSVVGAFVAYAIAGLAFGLGTFLYTGRWDFKT